MYISINNKIFKTKQFYSYDKVYESLKKNLPRIDANAKLPLSALVVGLWEFIASKGKLILFIHLYLKAFKEASLLKAPWTRLS